MKNPILRWAERQLGTGKLEHETTSAFIKGVVGRVIQHVAMTSFPLPPSFRVWLQRLRGVKIGKHVFLGLECCLDVIRPDLITIEDYVSLAGRVMVLTHSAPTEPLRIALGSELDRYGPVVIKRGAWVTVNCTILPGVTIGENAVVAAGSVVNKDVAPYTVVGGVPAKFIRTLKPHDDQDVQSTAQ